MGIVKYAAFVYPNIAFFPREDFSFKFDTTSQVVIGKVEATFGEVKDDYWKEWVGSLRWEKFLRSTVQIQVWCESKTPDVLDAESQALQARLYRFAQALMLTELPFPPHEKPELATGRGELKDGILKPLSIRSYGEGPRWQQPFYIRHEDYRKSPLHKKACEKMVLPEQFFKDWGAVEGQIRRVNESFNDFILANLSLYAFQVGLQDHLWDFRFPNLVRAAEHLFALKPGSGRGTFARRARSFLPAADELAFNLQEKEIIPLLKEAYEFRNDSVHGRPIAWGKGADRDRFLKDEMYKHEYLVEMASRHCIRRFIEDPKLLALTNDPDSISAHWDTVDPQPPRQRKVTCPVCESEYVLSPR